MVIPYPPSSAGTAGRTSPVCHARCPQVPHNRSHEHNGLGHAPERRRAFQVKDRIEGDSVRSTVLD